MHARVCLTILISALLPVITFPALSAMAQDIKFVERPENEFLILALNVNGVERDEGIVAYLPETQSPDKVLVPLGDFAQALSFSIEVNPGEGIAEGWFINEAKIFQLDLRAKQVTVGGVKTPLADGVAEAQTDDIFVRAEALERWFEVNIELDMSSLTLFIDTKTALPFQQIGERRERAERLLKKSYYNYNQAENAVLLPYKNFSLPHFIFQQSLTASKNTEQFNYSTASALQAHFDFMKFGTRLLLAGQYKKDDRFQISNSELTFTRRSPDRDLLGPLDAGLLAIGDVDYPDTPLFKGGQRGRGVAVSSDPQVSASFATNTEEFSIEGEAPIGWDAELYRNGHFIDFQEIGNDGRYDFENVTLLGGLNQFEIILYGPEGQKRTVTRQVYRGAEMLPAGDFRYSMSAGQPKADFLPLTEEPESDGTAGGSAQFFYGLTKYLTAGVSLFTGEDGSQQVRGRSNAATVSTIFSFLGTNTQLQAMAANKGRRSYDLEARTRFAGINLSFRHRENKGFLAEDKDVKRESGLHLTRSFGFLNTSLYGEKRTFQLKEIETAIGNLLSVDFFGMKFTNQLEKVLSKNEQQERFNGDFSILSSIFDTRLRGNLLYDLDPKASERLISARFSVFKDFANDTSLRITGEHQFDSGINSINLRYSYPVGPFYLDLTGGASDNDNYQAGITLRAALQPDATGNYGLVDARKGGLTNLGIRGFIDKNNNSLFDEGDEPIENVIFKASRGQVEGATGKDGLAVLNGLGEAPTRFSVDKASIPDIYLKAAKDSFDLIPRQGASSIIDFAFVQLGEIDGYVLLTGEDGESRNPAQGIEIEIADAQSGLAMETVKSEFDGYYLISSIPLGSYVIRVLPVWMEEEEEMPSREVTLTAEEPFISDVNFLLP